MRYVRDFWSEFHPFDYSLKKLGVGGAAANFSQAVQNWIH